MGKIRHLLATDLDGTFVGDDAALKQLLAYYNTLDEPVALAYITGRHQASVIELIDEESLPLPDILITDVGTVIYHGESLLEDELWTEKMTEDWQPDNILKIAEGISGLTIQKLPHQRRVSFYASSAESAEALKTSLLQKEIPHTFIFSSNRDVDILPEGGGKGEALKFLIENYVEKEAGILVAGDSGNDLAMLEAGYPAVIVANARPELADIEANELLYRASSSYAAGILEAWQHFYGGR